MSVNMAQGSGGIQDLTQTMLGGGMAMVDFAMQSAKVNMQMQLKMQEMATAQETIAMMTGVGGELNMQV